MESVRGYGIGVFVVLLPVLMTLAAAGRSWPEIKRHAHRNRWAILLWYVIWLAIWFVASYKEKAFDQWVAELLLRTAGALRPTVFSGWFLLIGLLLVLFHSEAKTLLARVTESLRSVEVKGVKLTLGEPDSTSIRLVAGWWSDDFSESDRAADTPAGAGPMRSLPANPPPEYTETVTEIKSHLRTLTDNTQDDVGNMIQDILEPKWTGEYVEYLQLSLDMVRQRIHNHELHRVTNRFLATLITIRHIMLYIHGEQDRAEQFLWDIQFIDAQHVQGTLRRAQGYWFLIALCERRNFSVAQELADHAYMRTSSLLSTRVAYQAYIYYKQGDYTKAIALVEAETMPISEASIVLLYVGAAAYLRMDRPLEAIGYAEKVILYPGDKPRGLLKYLRQRAMRTYAAAAINLRWYERLYDLYLKHKLAQHDPFILNAMAVGLAANGHKAGATDLLRRALDCLPRAGEEELRKTLEANLDKVRR